MKPLKVPYLEMENYNFKIEVDIKFVRGSYIINV